MRIKRDISQQKLADLVGTGKSQIVKLEKGERRLTDEWMRRIAAALNCDPSELMKRKGVALMGIVEADGQITPVTEADSDFEIFNPPPGVNPDLYGAIKLRKDMSKDYRQGDILYYLKNYNFNASILGYPCYIQLRDGTSHLKTINPGVRPGTYLLDFASQPVVEINAPDLISVHPIEFKKTSLPKSPEAAN